MVFLIKVTMLILRPSARHSTSALLMDKEVWPSIASSAPTEPSSTRTTSSATGGSTLTAPRLKVSTPRMRRLLLSERLPLLLHLTRPPTELLLLLATLQELLLPLLRHPTLPEICLPQQLLVLRVPMRLLSGLAGSWAMAGMATGEAARARATAAEDKRELSVHPQLSV